jgi:hypothetical protein
MPKLDAPFQYKLGKKKAVHDPKALLLADYLDLTTVLPSIPAHCYWGSKIKTWPMFGNDTLGDCTIAAAGHLVQEWTADESTEVDVPESAIIEAYSGACGYVVGDPSTDQGGVETVVLDYWKKTGIGGHKLFAYMSLEPGNIDHIKASVFLFGGVYIGIGLPVTAQSQSGPGLCWSAPPGGDATPDGTPGSWGGHAVPVIGYNANVLTIVTWGSIQYMTYKFWADYTDEAYAPLSLDWSPTAAGKVAPEGFDLVQLEADLKLV